MVISIDGLVSGLDTTTIISQIMNLEKRPIRLLENKQAVLADQKTAWQEVNTRLLSVETAANKMNTSAEFAARTASFKSNNSSGGSVLSLTASSSVAEGSYNLVVSQLALAQKSVGDQSYSSTTTAIGASGTITITAPSTGTPVNISVTSTDTLGDIQSAINNSGAAINATIINTGSTATPAYKLVLTGDNMGSANAFTATATLDTGTLSFSTTQSAQNAALTVDGIAVSQESNTLTDVISNATISLETIGSGTATFATDFNAIVDNVQGFIDAYNAASSFIKEQLTYDQAKNSRGILFGNSTLMTIQNKLRSVVNGAVDGIDITNSSKFSFLSQVGIATDQTDQLVMDTNKFRDNLKDNPTITSNLFTSAGSGTYTFVEATYKTTGGDYTTRAIDVGGGDIRLQMKVTGSADSTYVTLDKTGNFSFGPAGSIYDGLILNSGSLTAGETGSMNISVGVAQRSAGLISSYTEFSTEGLIFNQNKSIEDSDKELQKQVDDLDGRLAIKEEGLRKKFAQLEVLLSKLKSEQAYLGGQLAALPKSF